MNCHLDRSVAEWRDLRFCRFSRSLFSPWVVGAPAFMRGKERFSAPGKNLATLGALALAPELTLQVTERPAALYQGTTSAVPLIAPKEIGL
jgi:hypothetical protein